MLYLMGIMVNEKYRTYHMNFIKKELSMEEIDKVYDRIVSLTNSLINFDNRNESNVFTLYDDKVKRKIKKLTQNYEI